MAAAPLPGAASSPAAESVRSEVGFLPAVEGLRGVAVAWVMAFHWFVLRDGTLDDASLALARAWAPLEALVRNGYLGVDLFFVITGFLLTLPWFRHAMAGLPPPAARAFYARRAWRILPAYYVHLVILFFAALPLLHPRLWIQSTPLVAFNLGAHATFLHYTSPLTSSGLGVNGALWTLAVEAQYYLLVPLVAPLFVRWPWRSLAAAFVVAAGWRWLAATDLDVLVQFHLRLGERAGVPEAAVRHLLATQLPAWAFHFALGIVAGRAWLRRRQAATRAAHEVAAIAVALACAGLLLAALLHGTSALGAAGWAAYPVLVAGAFGAIVAWPSALLSRGAAVRPLAALGRISYSAYLYHLPLLLAFNAAVGTALGGAGVLAWTGTVVAVAWASHRWVEEPYLRGGGDRARPLASLAHRRDPGAK